MQRYESLGSIGSVVSILTGPLGPVQRVGPWPRPTRGCGFNPHRPFGAGATGAGSAGLPSPRTFQSSPALWGRCNHLRGPLGGGGCRVSILTGPLGPVQLHAVLHHQEGSPVSILTGPLGPVQPGDRALRQGQGGVSILTGPLGPVQLQGEDDGVSGAVPVSILTGPLGPVQLGVWRAIALPWLVFQSSPALWGRCNGSLTRRLPRL